MVKTEQEQIKKRILTLISRSGLSISTQDIVNQLKLPEEVVLTDLLIELVREGRLIRGCTLLVNGDVDYTYNLKVKPHPAVDAAN